MKDSEVRGLILNRLYEVRHSNHGMINLPDGLGIADIPPKVLGNCALQLDEHGLIKMKKDMTTSDPRGYAKITALGVDVVEDNFKPQIAITLDQSVNVHGAGNVQVGGQGNTQTSTDTSVHSVSAGQTANVAPAKSSIWAWIKGLWKIVAKWFGMGGADVR